MPPRLSMARSRRSALRARVPLMVAAIQLCCMATSVAATNRLRAEALAGTRQLQGSCDASSFCSTKGSGLYPSPCDSSCGSFMQCSNGMGWLQLCPGGLIYNPNIQSCDWSYNYQCPSAPSSPSPDASTSPVPSPQPSSPFPSPSPSPDRSPSPSPSPSPSSPGCVDAYLACPGWAGQCAVPGVATFCPCMCSGSAAPSASPSPTINPSPSPSPVPSPSPSSSPSPSPSPSPVPSPSPSASPSASPSPSSPPQGLPLRVQQALLATDHSQVLRSQQPDSSWAPSTVYFWPDMISALTAMHTKGVAAATFWLGDASDNGWKYGLVSVAAFLAQSMKETIQYDACDENNWDQTSGYAASNACGQLGQSYQDYKCPAGQEMYQCDVDPSMEIRANTHAKWYGAPPAFFCAPRSKLPAAPKWDYGGAWCDPNQPHNPNMSFDEYVTYVKSYGADNCRDYAGQKAGKWSSCGGPGCANAPAPAFGRQARTDVEGCCWWGRGVIQTTGVCNFGKLNYFLGARAAREGREAMFPDVDFCRDPQAICSSTAYPQLKWIAGLYYFMNEVQPWSEPAWNYFSQLKRFVDTGMNAADTAFIDGVSGIVNRGCTTITGCPAGAVDGVSDRRSNFRAVLKAMHLVAQ